jgi:hypothetical protein
MRIQWNPSLLSKYVLWTCFYIYVFSGWCEYISKHRMNILKDYIFFFLRQWLREDKNDNHSYARLIWHNTSGSRSILHRWQHSPNEVILLFDNFLIDGKDKPISLWRFDISYFSVKIERAASVEKQQHCRTQTTQIRFRVQWFLRSYSRQWAVQ